MTPLEKDIQEVLLTASQIEAKVKEMGRKISQDFAGQSLVVIGILKGAIIFLSDLVRAITVPITLDFIAVSSYGASTSSSGAVRILKDLDTEIEGKNVLLVEDIVDTGLTLRYLSDNLRARKPAIFKTCTFLDKPSRREVDVQLDYNGFTIPDVFVVGYGLDFAERYRQLPFIAVLKPEAYKRGE